ncbi:hypothetical protein Tco_0737073 [Tanacetum coccineum]
MSIQDMEDLKQHYLEEMLSLSNDLQIEDYRNEKIDICFRRECESMIDELKGKFNGMSIEINKKKELQHLQQVANLSNYPSRRFNSFYDDDDEESSIPLRDIISELPPSVVITPDLPITNSLIMRDEHLSTIPKKELDEFIKSSVEDLVLIPSESEDTFGSDSDCDLSSCNDFSPINVYEEKSVTFSNPLFDSNDDFTSSDDESLSNEDVLEENVKIYSNPLFEFNDEYISSDINPLFDKVLENIESKDSYVSNFDELALLVTPLSAFNEDECFDLGGDVDEIELLLHRDSSTPKISVASILEGFTDEPPLEENDDLFDLESKENEWKKILYDAPINDMMAEDKVFDPGILEKFFSPTYVRLPFEDRHYLSLTYVIRIFLPYLTYSKDSSLLLSSGSEETIFDPGISVFSCYSLEPVVSHQSGTFMCFNVYLNILNESMSTVQYEEADTSVQLTVSVEVSVHVSTVNCSGDGWTNPRVTRGTGVCQPELQALVDRKKIIITEEIVRRDLQLEDVDGVDCMPNATIFEKLTLMGYEKLSQGEGSDMPTDPHHTPTIIPPSTSQPQRKQRPRKPKRKDTEIPQSSVPVENVADEAVYEERDDSLERATTTATGLDAEQDRGNISKTQSKATPNEPSSIGTSSGGGPRRQDTMGDTIAQTRSENVSKFSNDLLLAGVNTPRSGEDSLQLKELMEFCTKLQQRVLDLENTKTAQAQEITSLKKRVKKLERKKKSRTHGLKRLYKVGLSARIDSSDDEASLGDQEDASYKMRKIHVLLLMKGHPTRRMFMMQ